MNGKWLHMSPAAFQALRQMREDRRVVEFRFDASARPLSHAGQTGEALVKLAQQIIPYVELARNGLVLMHDERDRLVFILKSKDSKGSPV